MVLLTDRCCDSLTVGLHLIKETGRCLVPLSLPLPEHSRDFAQEPASLPFLVSILLFSVINTLGQLMALLVWSVQEPSAAPRAVSREGFLSAPRFAMGGRRC